MKKKQINMIFKANINMCTKNEYKSKILPWQCCQPKS